MDTRAAEAERQERIRAIIKSADRVGKVDEAVTRRRVDAGRLDEDLHFCIAHFVEAMRNRDCFLLASHSRVQSAAKVNVEALMRGAAECDENYERAQNKAHGEKGGHRYHPKPRVLGGVSPWSERSQRRRQRPSDCVRCLWRSLHVCRQVQVPSRVSGPFLDHVEVEAARSHFMK
jgi:hypothetical protein